MAAGKRVFAEIQEIDKGARKLLVELAKLKKKPYVKAGLLESSGKHGEKKGKKGQVKTKGSGPSVVEVATFQEFGTKTIPERAFLRLAMDENRGKLNVQIDKLFSSIVEGKMTVEQALKVLGLSMKKEIQSKIRRGPWTPNAPSTVRAKGSSSPLIDSAQMLNSINFEVKEGGDND